jgi:hypothetical protein
MNTSLAFSRQLLEAACRYLKNITDRIDLKLLKTKTFGCGAVIHNYELAKK